MLRLAVLLLLLANALYFAWSQSLLAAWGFAPAQQAEPQRLQQQLRPQALRILGADEAKRVEAAAAQKVAECLQAGPLDDSQVAAVRPVLDSWPAGAWSFEPAVEPARWIVYMGKYPNADALNKKRAELRQLGVNFEPLNNPALEPGLSLGGYPTETEAKRELDVLTKRGVKTAKVERERDETRGQMLKLPAIDDSLRPRMDELRTALAAKTLRACR